MKAQTRQWQVGPGMARKPPGGAQGAEGPEAHLVFCLTGCPALKLFLPQTHLPPEIHARLFLQPWNILHKTEAGKGTGATPP